jgi:hypothetical protein
MENWKTGNEAENVDEGVGEKCPCIFGKLTEMLPLKSDRALIDLLLPAV